ncbi:MAG: aminoacyl-tRNA hydrolase [Cyanobacteria bacterium P01_H01_bin.74]
MTHLIVGLGNPGKKYEKTRHNVGFLALDHLAERFTVPLKPDKNFQANVGIAKSPDFRLILAQPTTYMNLSGVAVSHLMRYYKVATENLLVIVDDVALPFGTLRFRPSGSDGGQKGLRSIATHLNDNTDFSRLRLGVGAAPEQMDLSDHVLSQFSNNEWTQLPNVLSTACEAALFWVSHSADDNQAEMTMSRFNGSVLEIF